MTRRLGRVLTVGTLTFSLCAAPASAGDSDPLPRRAAPETHQALRAAIRQAGRSIPNEPAATARTGRQDPYGRITRVRHGRLRREIGALLGGVGGMLAGGYLGAKIEGDSCRCDDPGFQGFLIGAPIGALVGGLAGVAIASR